MRITRGIGGRDVATRLTQLQTAEDTKLGKPFPATLNRFQISDGIESRRRQ
jgi:hypothetical protein